MQQYVIIAHDGDDQDALQRRLSVRSAHLQGAKALKAEGHFVTGGATLDAEGKMNGSVMIVQFETEEQLNEWLSSEPYIHGKVWQSYQVKPFKVADV